MDKIALMNRARLKKVNAKYANVEHNAREFFRKHKSEPLFASGIALYWAEGTRLSSKYRKYQLTLTNSDAGLLSFYCRFARKYFNNFNNQNIRAAIFAHPDVDVKKATAHWSRSLGISGSQFIKPQILPVRNVGSCKLKYGTCCVYINSKEACLIMQVWIKALCEDLRG